MLQRDPKDPLAERAIVILIGDVPGNTPSEVVQRRSSNRGEDYWIKTRFASCGHYEPQLDILISKGRKAVLE